MAIKVTSSNGHVPYDKISPQPYPIRAVGPDGSSGEVHRVSFLPQQFIIPSGKITVLRRDEPTSDGEDNGEETITRSYPRQPIVLKIPDIDIFLPESDCYSGPVFIPLPEYCATIIRCNGPGKITESVQISTPKETRLRYWPRLRPGQTITQWQIMCATSRHHVRGEVNGNCDHLVRQMNGILSLNELRNHFTKNKKDLRRLVLERNAKRSGLSCKKKMITRGAISSIVTQLAEKTSPAKRKNTKKERKETSPKIPCPTVPLRRSPRKHKPTPDVEGDTWERTPLVFIDEEEEETVIQNQPVVVESKESSSTEIRITIPTNITPPDALISQIKVSEKELDSFCSKMMRSFKFW